MTKARVKRLLFAFVVLGIAALLVPGSPIYLPDLLKPAQKYAGQPKSYWIDNLKNPDPQIRLDAIRAMGEFGPDAREAVPTLTQYMLEDSDRLIRNEAALALSKMSASSAVPAFAQALEDREPLVRLNACLALSRLKKEARPALPALIKALNDEDNDTNANAFHFTIQEIAALSIGRVTAGTVDGVPALIEALASARTSAMRTAIARAFGEIGPEARDAAPQLRKLLKDNNHVREAALVALQAIGADPNNDGDQASAAEIELAKPEREYLWNIEHHGNLLVKHGFAPLAAALKRADRKALVPMLADRFTGADLRQAHAIRPKLDFAVIERLDDLGTSSSPMNREAFVDRLLELRKVFGESPPQVKWALMALSPKERGKAEGPWQGTAQLRMHGETSKGAPAEVVVYLAYEVQYPTEAVLAQSGWLRSARLLQVLSARAPNYFFAEVGQERGLKSTGLHDNWTAQAFLPVTGGVYVCDFDRDGILDVLITDVRHCTLYRGLADGYFEDATTLLGLRKEQMLSGATAWVDIDGDGWEDLILAGRIYRNKAGRQFEDHTSRFNPSLPLDVSGIIVADYDRDGKLDLYLSRAGRPNGSSWMDGGSGTSRGNVLLRNLGNWQFENATKISGTRGSDRSAFTAAWLDANNDGWPDLHVINEFGDGQLLINNCDGTFSAHALADRSADFGSMGLAVGDIDNDGNIDIYCANMYSKAGSRVIGNLAPDAFQPNVLEKMRRFVAGSQLHLNKGNLKFEQVGKKMQVAAVGWAYGACLADLDNDGFLDIYATAGFVSRDRSKPDG